MHSPKRRRLSSLLGKKSAPTLPSHIDKKVERLELEILRIQDGLFQNQRRAMIIIEGFDAAGKGGVIRTLTQKLDPRGVTVHPIGPPEKDEQAKHWLYRFWMRLPKPGVIAIFDRSWYGRVLVERVDHLTPKKNWKRAFEEINQFEAMLTNDGVQIVKIFLAVSKKEQLKRFEERLQNPAKHWKLTPSDIRARSQWKKYQHAADDLLFKTHTKRAPWHLLSSDNKAVTHLHALEIVSRELHQPAEKKAQLEQKKQLKKSIAALKRLK